MDNQQISQSHLYKTTEADFVSFFQDFLQRYSSENTSSFGGTSDFSKKKSSKKSDNASSDPKIDVVIIVAVPNEKDGAYNAFNLSKATSKKLDFLDRYRFDYVQFNHDGLNIALLIQPSMGMTQSASLTSRAILAFQPKLVAMVGICAGRKEKVSLGDIVIASDVFDYTAGKQYVDRFGPRPKSYPIDDTLASYIVGSIIDKHELVGKIVDAYQGDKPSHQISIHFKPIASGTAVIDDPKIVQDIIKNQDDLVGIDMEAYALAVSSNILRTKWIIIKSVQDFADGEKSTTETGIRSFAAYSSAKLLALILKDLSNYF